jgi:ABC-type polysaccharide transport system permease subunit
LYVIQYTKKVLGYLPKVLLLISLFYTFMVNKTKSIKEYEEMTLAQLRVEAKKLGLEDFMELQKRELIFEILKKLLLMRGLSLWRVF